MTIQISLKTKYEFKGQRRSHKVIFNSPFCKLSVCFLFDYVQFGSKAMIFYLNDQSFID